MAPGIQCSISGPPLSQRDLDQLKEIQQKEKKKKKKKKIKEVGISLVAQQVKNLT